MLRVNSTTIWGRFALRNVHSEILDHGVVLEPSSEDPDSLPSVSAIHSPIPLWAEANPPIVKMRKLESLSRSTPCQGRARTQTQLPSPSPEPEPPGQVGDVWPGSLSLVPSAVPHSEGLSRCALTTLGPPPRHATSPVPSMAGPRSGLADAG